MTLQQGARFGPYEIAAAIGVGGMGEVYRARDVRLDRTVAIKILPDLFAADPMTTGSSDGVRACARSAADRLMAVDVLPGTGFRTSEPKQLFRASRPLTILSDWQPR